MERKRRGLLTTNNDYHTKIKCVQKARSTQSQTPQPASHVFGIALFPSNNMRLVTDLVCQNIICQMAYISI